ncbi:MAG: hypothetical protein PQJ61_04580 [Spirochaetales bacterium]|uniref:Lipoprotein n=1 Tax=Candidatus Thalassospirochaeta sargassi TaxID=3119039 RepID=A0AAJ1MI88_9SPIO|nr:hypothetical protein [Spirochaetales bacterium]
MKNALKILVGIALVSMLFSCASTDFSEKTSLRDNEMTAFENISLGSISMDDVEIVGNVEAVRTVTYVLQMNGDYVIEMDDYKYSYTALDGTTEVTGTRVVGNLKGSSVGGADLFMPASGGLLSGLFGAVSVDSDATAASVSKMDPKDIALEAVNYDLMKKAAAKGGVALLLPDYSWEIEEELNGTETEAFLFLPASKVYETKNLTYTVTARAAAVSF